LSDAANVPKPADARARRVAVAVPCCPQAAAWIATRLGLGPALACVALDDQHGLPEAFAGRLDTLVWCVEAAAVRTEDLRHAVTAMRPRRIAVLVVPAGFVPGDPPCVKRPPPLGSLRAALLAAAVDRPLFLASAGWGGEPLDRTLEALAGRLLRDPPGGEHQR
jgi:hypothetical protein